MIHRPPSGMQVGQILTICSFGMSGCPGKGGWFSLHQVDSGRLVVWCCHVDDAVHYFAGSQQLDQLAGTHHCRQTVLASSLFKTTGGFGFSCPAFWR